MEHKIIRFVAIYLRKSRGDAETDLDKHEKTLVDMCKTNKWKYTIVKEIGSGDSIHVRSEFQRLLDDIQKGSYDAVCVMDYDRLGRGDEEEQGRIKKILMRTDTYVATPDKILDLNNPNDQFTADAFGFIARQEYKQIVKRLLQGKKMGAKMGRWSNGTPHTHTSTNNGRTSTMKKGWLLMTTN